MKCEWKRCTIGDLGRIITGKTPNTKVTEYWDGNIPFVTPKDLQGTKHIDCTERSITSNGLDAVKGSTLPANSVCVSCIGNIGYTGITTQKGVTNQQINAIVVNKCNNFDFVYYLLRNLWSYFKNYEGQSTTLSILNKTQFSKIGITIPDLETQKKIAKVLSALDDKIELNNQINKNLEEQANALFERQFINNDNLPVNWTQGSLLDIADYLNGLAMQSFRPSDNEIGLPVLKIKELRQGLCDDNSELCSPSIKSEYIVHDGDVIFSWSGSLLVDLWCGGTCGLNQHLFKVTSNKYDKWYYYLWTKHHLKHFIGVASDKATTMGHIKRGDLLNAKVLIPSERDYKSMSSIFKPIIEKIVTNRIENRKLALIRDAILPKLMSGEIDVDNVEI